MSVLQFLVEIITNNQQRCNLVIEFIIPKFTERSTRFERHTTHHQQLRTVFAASGLYTHVVTSLPPSLDNSRLPHVYINQRLQIQLELLTMMSGVPLETC
jgi:hypothetical protein